MRKLLALALVICLCFSMTLVFASCGEKEDTTETTTAAEGESNAEDAVPNPDPVILRPADCTIVNGGGEEELKIEENGNLGYWKTANTATWDIAVKKDGKYKVTINYAKGTTQDSEVKVVVGEKVLSARVAPTGDWTAYVDFDMGTIDLTTADTKLTVEPGEMPESDLMNLLTLTLTYQE